MKRGFALTGLALTGMIVTLGTAWAFLRGANDFRVFHTAWQLVLAGRGMEIYQNSPDRYLYAPGFAWLLCPLGFLPQRVALAVWSLAKAAALGYVVREFARHLDPARFAGPDRIIAVGTCAWGVMMVARPLLIDLQYGQVNTLIVAAGVAALFGHFRREPASAWNDGVRWFLLACASVAKLFALPLLAVPFVLTVGINPDRLRIERAALCLGIVAMLGLPVLGEGFSGDIRLHSLWREALLAKGLPLESHNQSFIAFLNHYFTANPVHVIPLGSTWVVLGRDLLSPATIERMGFAWFLIFSGILLGWILNAKNKSPLSWIATVIGLLIVPSYLVWKPYFVFTLPAAFLAVHRAIQRGSGLNSKTVWPLLFFAFFAMNLSGVDWVGPYFGARFEAGSLMLFSHLLLIGMAAADLTYSSNVRY